VKLTTYLHLIKSGGAIPPLSHVYSWHGAELIKHRDSFSFFTYSFIKLLLTREVMREVRWSPGQSQIWGRTPTP
jgi:hypothetical protein